jgi:murein L,D-transpeptidase YafK
MRRRGGIQSFIGLRVLILIAMTVMISGGLTQQASAASFREQQMRFSRVEAAYVRRSNDVVQMFRCKDLPWPPRGIFLRAFKRDAMLELWGKEAKGNAYVLVKRYQICASSGNLGPKRRVGDGQVPEGFYHVRTFNPASNFHLSLGLDYPNASDRILGGKGPPGGDIFIHGNCVTIGCIPVTDPMIEEIYIVAVEARSNGQQRIPVHIFPGKLDEAGLADLLREAGEESELARFWINLQEGYEVFEKTHVLPDIKVGRSGRYRFNVRH